MSVLSTETHEVLLDVGYARQRQEQMKAEGRFQFTCADPHAMTHAEKLAVLVEEVGEVAREVLTQDGSLALDTVGSREALRHELVQVAAVAVAWVESLSGDVARNEESAVEPRKES